MLVKAWSYLQCFLIWEVLYLLIIMDSTEMLQDRDHDDSTIIVTLCQHHNYHYFYALGNVIIIILRDKVLMAYWQLILFPMASSCTSALYLWIWLSVANRSLHYKYYQSFSPLHHSNIRYFPIVQKSRVAKLRQEGICIFLLLDLEFFHYKLVLPLCYYVIKAAYSSKIQKA